MKKAALFYCILLPQIAVATTNLGTINTIRNGFATVKECQRDDEPPCDDSRKTLLEQGLELATIGQCVASLEDYKKGGIDVPKCPEGQDDIKGLDNTYPNGGIFALWTGNNSLFIKDLAGNYFKNDKVGKFNLVLPKNRIEDLKNNPALVEILNSKRVNIVYVNTMPSVDRWMQDSFQFTTINSKPALYQMEHASETESEIKRRLACELAKNCDIPYYIPPDMVNPHNSEENSQNSGGNLEVLPGGAFLSGIKDNRPTEFQRIQRESLEQSGNKVLEIDVSFLFVGHVDEMFSFVKTDRPAPCDFAVMMASPEKAFELLEEAADAKMSIMRWINPLNFFISQAYAALSIKFDPDYPVNLDNPADLVDPIDGSLFKANRKFDNPVDPCEKYRNRELMSRDVNNPISEHEMKEMKKHKCIDGGTAQSFVNSKEYDIIKRIHKEGIKNSPQQSADQILNKNRKLITEELKRSTGCKNPPVIKIPVFFRNGESYTPNLVNGVVQTPPGEASNVILPRSYFAPFDEYVEEELSKYGVGTTFAHDMGYHLRKGDVHCGTNSARIGRP